MNPYLPRSLPSLLGLAVVAACANVRPDTAQPSTAEAGVSAAAEIDPELRDRLAAIDRVIDRKRKELHVPGVALAIVKGGKLIHARGFGHRDLAKKLPVTPQTVFAIGSVSKSFTAMTTLIAADEGKLSLDQSPRKCLPYFALADAEADAKIQVRDLLIHSSGLGRTDQSWIYGDLTREQAIRIASEAKSLVPLRSGWNYQNTMYTAAGECAAQAMGQSYEELVRDRVFAPLGMESASAYLEGLTEAPERAIGYEIQRDDTGEPEGVIPAWVMDLSAIAPAGSINANVEDMAKWLGYVLAGGGTADLVKPELFAEFTRPQMKIAEGSQYALGWFVDEWRNKTKVHHGGNVAGFSAMVAMLPEEELGYVMLTNLSGTPLASTVSEAVFSLTLNEKVADKLLAKIDPGETTKTGDPGAGRPAEAEIGTYEISPTPEDTILAAVTHEQGHLHLTVPGQPVYRLRHISGRKYGFTPPESEREYFVTFRPSETDEGATEAYLEQPGAKAVLRKVDDDPARGLAAAAIPAQDLKAMAVFHGIYEAPKQRLPVAPRIESKEGHVVLSGVGGVQGLALVATEDADRYALHGAPRLYVEFRRDDAGKIEGFELDVRGRQQIWFARTGELPPELPAPKMGIDRLMRKVARAHGAERLAKKKTMTTVAHTRRPYEGMGVELTIKHKAPNQLAIREVYTSLGATIMEQTQTFDGKTAAVDPGKYEARKIRGRARADLERAADFNPILNWRTLYDEVTIEASTRIDGKLVYVIELRPKKGSVVTQYIDAQRFLIVGEDLRSPGSSAVTEVRMSDFRRIDGVTLPFRIVRGAGATRSETQVVDVKFDEPIADREFTPRRRVGEYQPLPVGVGR